MKILKIIILAVFTTVLLQACKKGDNDPFLSLKTRDARITGTWELMSSEEIDSYTNTFLDYDNEPAELHIKENTLYSEGSLIYSYVQTLIVADSIIDNYAGSDTTDFSEQLTILKLGVIEFAGSEDKRVYEAQGSWQWFDSNKRKTQIEIDGMVYVVDRLTNEELVLKYTGYYIEIDKTYNEEYDEQYSIVKTYQKK